MTGLHVLLDLLPSTVIVGSVLASLVLVGILVLIAWKIITTIKDNREYKAFINEQHAAKWNDVSMKFEELCNVLLFLFKEFIGFQQCFSFIQNMSPIFKPANTTIANPMFQKAID